MTFLMDSTLQPTTLEVKSMNIVGDVHGQYKTLKALIRKMPPGTPISLGDMVDRGPRSRQVLEFFKEYGYAILGNHEHLMLDWLYSKGIYGEGHYLENCGGGETLKSFVPKSLKKKKSLIMSEEELKALIYPELKEWLNTLPKYLKLQTPTGTLLLTHAPLDPVIGLIKALKAVDFSIRAKGFDTSIIWNRGNPRIDKEFTLQLYGHQPRKNVELHKLPGKKNEEPFAIGLDTGKGGKLSGMHWPSRKIYEQDWIDR